MYGGEVALRMVFFHLAHVERCEDRWFARQQEWKARGAFTSTGVTGAFASSIPGHYEYGVASVYAGRRSSLSRAAMPCTAGMCPR
jgi:hypothetical protein